MYVNTSSCTLPPNSSLVVGFKNEVDDFLQRIFEVYTDSLRSLDKSCEAKISTLWKTNSDLSDEKVRLQETLKTTEEKRGRESNTTLL